MRWVDVIQDLVNAYNHSHDRSIGMTPADIQKDKNRLWMRRFRDGGTYLKHQIPNKAMVRACSHKTIFDKVYMPNLTKEHFTVSKTVPPRKKNQAPCI